MIKSQNLNLYCRAAAGGMVTAKQVTGYLMTFRGVKYIIHRPIYFDTGDFMQCKQDWHISEYLTGMLISGSHFKTRAAAAMAAQAVIDRKRDLMERCIKQFPAQFARQYVNV